MNVAETLRRAKEEIDVRGWCKRTPLDRDGRVCAIGAVWFASGGAENNWPRNDYYSVQDYIHSWIRQSEAAIYLSSYLRRIPVPTDINDPSYTTWTSQIWWWNDDALSSEEIKDGLEAAARKWEQENA